MSTIPKHPLDIDWLRSVFNDPDLQLLETEPLEGGYMSCITRVHLCPGGRVGESISHESQDYESNRGELEAPPSAIVKTAAQDKRQLDIALSYGSYRKETRFYRELSRGLNVRVPHCYLNEISDDGKQFVLVLEDMQGSGNWVKVEQLASASKAQTLQAVETLAALHASNWAQAGSVDSDDRRQLPTFQEAVEAASTGFSDMLGNGLAKTGVLLPDAVHQRLLDFAAAPASYLADFLAVPQTLIHGDFRSANVFFRKDGSGAALIDWGDHTFGPAVLDLTNFLVTSLAVEQRRAWEDEAIARYTASLAAQSVSVSVKGVGVGVVKEGIRYSLQACRQDYQTLMPVCAWLPSFIALSEAPSEIRLARELYLRLADALT